MSTDKRELSGFSHLLRNVVFGWGAYVFVLVVGFIVPRQISDRLGTELLGIWDLGWATVRYLTLSNFGIGPAISRFVALYRAENDLDRLCSVRTSASFLAFAAASVAFLGALFGSHFIAEFAEIPDGANLELAKVVLFLLGVSVAVRMLGTASAGVLTGCHRFDITTSINAAEDVVLAGVMIFVLSVGGGLDVLAFAVIAVAGAATVTKMILARRICPEARVSLRHLVRKRTLELLRFGGKSTVASIPNVLIFQTSIILLSGAAGPGAVAILTRGMALVRHCEHLSRRAAMLFVPITSGLVGLREKDQLNRLLTQIGGYGLALTLPMLLFLFFFGDLVLALWMGPAYANAAMIKVLTVGAVLPVAQIGTTNVLAGLNAHGRVALASVAVSLAALILAVPIVNTIGWSPVTAAALIGFSWTCARGLVLPLFLKVRYGFSLIDYLIQSIIRPAVLNAPFALLLWGGRLAFDEQMLKLCVFLLSLATVLNLLIYWRLVLPVEAKRAILGKILPARKQVD
jgi:O-antigen/teichoic acid export membrane protein